MCLRQVLFIGLLAVTCAPAVVAGEAAQSTAATAVVRPAASESARGVLARVRGSIVQIKAFQGANTAPVHHGSGFAVAAGGVFATNYHVVADHVLRPEKYRLEYRTDDGKTGKIAVLAIDVRHDLALVRADDHAPPPLPLNPALPPKGERAYSVGFPLDVGLTITEGVANGLVDNSFLPHIHYSGALNGGMSGGPALNAVGEVIGVNVARVGFAELVNLLVPARYLDELRRRGAAPSSAGDLKAATTEQLRAHTRDLLQAFAGPLATQKTSGYMLPDKLAPFVSCSAAGGTGNQPLKAVRISCSTKAGIYMRKGLRSGDLQFQHVVLTSAKLGPWRFAHKLSERTHASGMRGVKRDVGPFACQNHDVKLEGFDANLLICARSYRKHRGLYDFTVRLVSLSGSGHGVSSHLDLWGAEFDPGMTFIQRYVEAIAWKP